MIGTMRLPEPRGPLSEALVARPGHRHVPVRHDIERADRVAADRAPALTDEDLQISLAVCYELHYRGFDEVSDDWEWDPALLRLRAGLEQRHLRRPADLVGPPR